MRLNSWFEIDESQYMWYILQGYTIEVESDRVIWRLDGETHRESGPAIIWSDETHEWFLNDEIHRTDGPAVIKADGTQGWYLNDTEYTEDEWKITIKQLV